MKNPVVPIAIVRVTELQMGTFVSLPISSNTEEQLSVAEKNWKVLVDVVSYLVFPQKPLSSAETYDRSLNSLSGHLCQFSCQLPPLQALLCHSPKSELPSQCSSIGEHDLAWGGYITLILHQQVHLLVENLNHWNCRSGETTEARVKQVYPECLSIWQGTRRVRNAAIFNFYCLLIFSSSTGGTAGRAFLFLFVGEDKVAHIVTDLYYRSHAYTSLLP